MFKEYTVLSKEFSRLIGLFKKDQEEAEELLHSGIINYDEFLEKDRAVFLTYKSEMKKIRDFIVSHYGEETFFEFCQKLNWSVHNGDYIWLEDIGAIDKSIVSLINTLNDLGFETKFSCSGIKNEHKKDPKTGYIMFVNLSSEQISKIKRIAFKNGFFVLLKERVTYDNLKLLNKEEQLIIYNEGADDFSKMNLWDGFLSDLKLLNG